MRDPKLSLRGYPNELEGWCLRQCYSVDQGLSGDTKIWWKIYPLGSFSDKFVVIVCTPRSSSARWLLISTKLFNRSRAILLDIHPLGDTFAISQNKNTSKVLPIFFNCLYLKDESVRRLVSSLKLFSRSRAIWRWRVWLGIIPLDGASKGCIQSLYLFDKHIPCQNRHLPFFISRIWLGFCYNIIVEPIDGQTVEWFTSKLISVG